MPTAHDVFADVTRYLDDQPSSGTLQLLQRAVLDKARRTLAEQGAFSIVDFPLAINESLRGSAPQGATIAGAALLFYAAADVADDAADHDLTPDPWERWGSEQASNTGVSLLFSSLQYLIDRFDPEQAQLLVACLIRAGGAMSLGQHLDLLGQNLETPNINDYLLVVERKTGASFGAYAEAVALCHAESRIEARTFHAFGVALGTMLQMISDVHELWRADLSSDFVNRRLSLPIVLALEQVASTRRGELNALLAGDHDRARQQQLVKLLEELGIKAYASLRIEVYRKRAGELARRLGLDGHPYLRRLIEFPAFPLASIPL